MTRSTRFALFALCVGAAAAGWPAAAPNARAQPGGAQEAAAQDEDFEARLYDLRDVAALLDRRGIGDSLDELVQRIANATGTGIEDEFVESVYLVVGEPQAHGRFAAQLGEIRGLFRYRYEVEVACYAADEREAAGVAIGAGVPATARGESGTVLFRSRTTASRRVPVTLSAQKGHSYVARWSPVVGTSSVGYDAIIGTVEDGISVEATVGAGEETGGSTPLRLVGIVQHVTIAREQGPASAAGTFGSALTLGLPTRAERSFDTELHIPLDRDTVVAVLQGLDAGQSLVVTARVRRLAEPDAEPRRPR